MSSPPPENINIFIIDDKIDNIMMLELALERDGLKIFTSTSPKDVIQMCIDNDISIALIDVKMPGIDGFEVLDLIKSNPLTKHILVVLITGFNISSEYAVKGLSKGAVDYLFKPIDLHIVVAKVSSLVVLVNHQREIQRKNQELESYQKDLFKAIKETEKRKVFMENFLANMSHEIRTPLNAIVGLTSLLRETPLSEEQLEMINLMLVSSNSLIGIVNDILESARIDSGKVEIIRGKTNIIDLVQNICDLTNPLANQKGLKLICEVDKNVPPMIMADSLRLNQILINIVNNAIKFTNSGGINVSLKVLEKRNDNVLLEFIVKDSGIGIPKSSIDKIFTRFEQVEDKTFQKFGGTGLGLSIVKRLVELMGGALKVDSKIGEGTTFRFEIWHELADEGQKPTSDLLHLRDLPKFENSSVLLAEDNAASQFVIVKMLEEWNINVDVAKNGLEAVEKFKQKNYNLIIMDTHMPVMNGIEATRKIRKYMDDSKKDIPILTFSASVIEKEKQEAKNAGANDFMEKPFEPRTFYNKIRNMLRDSRGLKFAVPGI